MIGSTTKSLTSLLMARLVDEKKLTWDTPLVSLMPSFALADAEVTKKVAEAPKLQQRKTAPADERNARALNDKFRSGRAKLNDLAALLR